MFCPYCDELIENSIYAHWVGDYETLFDMECPECEKLIEVEVEVIPNFCIIDEEKLRKTNGNFLIHKGVLTWQTNKRW